MVDKSSRHTHCFCKIILRKTIEATIMKIVPNDSKLVIVINKLVNSSLLLSVVFYTNCFSTKKKLKSCHFFGDVNVSVTGKIVLTLNAR